MACIPRFFRVGARKYPSLKIVDGVTVISGPGPDSETGAGAGMSPPLKRLPGAAG